MEINDKFDNYWIRDNKIIFKPNFNEKLSNYIKIISKYNELMFSNYDNVEIIFKTKNKYNYHHNSNYKPSIFNQPIIYLQILLS